MSKVTDPEPPPDLARRLVDANVYLTLATADDSGRPWATPVWYAARDCDEFVWVSRPDARHSLNIAARPEVGIVIFDSTVPVGGAAAVYVEPEAEQVGPDDRTNALAIFNGRSEAQELRRGWSPTSSHRRRTGSIERRRDRSTSWTTRTAGFPSPERVQRSRVSLWARTAAPGRGYAPRGSRHRRRHRAMDLRAVRPRVAPGRVWASVR